jgi:UDP-2,3-diacylglucosamine hydrolase
MDGTTGAVSPAVPSAGTDGPLALICGGGTIPPVVAAAVAASGRRVVLFALRGWADPAFVATYPHHWIAIGQMGRFLRLVRQEGCRDVILIGTLLRPSLRDIRLDWTTLRLMPQAVRLFRGGDDHLLSGVGRMLEGYGLRLLGAHEVAPSILVPAGAMTRRLPTAGDRADIARAQAVLEALGPLDVGQGVVVADGYVAAVEAAEGTDAMLARIAELRRVGRLRTKIGVGVLVKVPKRGQDMRIDLPSIGPKTIEGVAAAGLAGLAVAAGRAVIADPGETVSLADRLGVFAVGLEDQP